MTYFLGPAEDDWGTLDYRNWIWTGGNDIEEEGHWVWLDGTDVEKDGFTIPWRPVAGGDNAGYISGTNGQHALSISRWGEFDDSFHDTKRRKRPFACQCPGS